MTLRTWSLQSVWHFALRILLLSMSRAPSFPACDLPRSPVWTSPELAPAFREEFKVEIEHVYRDAQIYLRRREEERRSIPQANTGRPAIVFWTIPDGGHDFAVKPYVIRPQAQTQTALSQQRSI